MEFPVQLFHMWKLRNENVSHCLSYLWCKL